MGHLEAVGLPGIRLDLRLDRHLRPPLLHRAQVAGKIAFNCSTFIGPFKTACSDHTGYSDCWETEKVFL